MKRRKSTAVAVLLAWLLVAAPALAHHLGADARVKDGKVVVEAFYDDDSPGRDAKVTLLDDKMKVIEQGRTDAKGRWSCPVPKPGVYAVVVDAGPGHSAKTKLTVPAEKAPAEPSAPTTKTGPDR